MAHTGELTNGMKVMSGDGASLGKIIRVEPGSFLVEKGFFFPKDYAVPLSMVREIRDGACWLSATKEELERMRETGGTAGYGDEAAGYGTAGGAIGSAGAPRGGATGEGTEAQRLTLSEEELEARKRVRDAGEVTVRKDVVTEHRRLDVPVTREEVHVERSPATSASAPEGAFDEKTLRVPIREEEVEVTKRPRVREEIRVSKSARQEERRVEGEVRREEARIDRSGEEGGRSIRDDGEGAGIRDDEK